MTKHDGPIKAPHYLVAACDLWNGAVIHQLNELIEWARHHQMTPDELRAQRRSFAYGNTAIENNMITREMIADADRRLFPEGASPHD